MRRYRTFVLAILALGLVAATCDTRPIQTPVARAGADQTVALGTEVVLDGSASSDADGSLLTFGWTLVSAPAGSQATLVDASTAVARFTPDVLGEYVLELAVSDGPSEDRDQIVVQVVTGPVAEAGADRTVLVGAPVVLDGTGSSDPNGDPLTFNWTLVALPDGSSATLNDASTSVATFVPDVAGAYEARLEVSNGNVSAFDAVVVTAVSSANRPPIADAGPNQTVTAGDRVFVNGAGSSDPDGDALEYNWSLLTWPNRTTEPAPELSNPSAVSPGFTASSAGSYTLELTVSDGVLTDSDRVTITAESATPTGTIYVGTGGNDANPGTEAEPLRTLGEALTVAHDHPTVTAIFLYDGTYATGETFDYVISRDLFIEGESQDGVVLAAGATDVFTMEQPEGASQAVRLFLTDLTIETTGTGVALPGDTEANLTRVTCRGTDPCVVAADIFGLFPVAGGTLTLRDSLLTGFGQGNGLKILGGGHLIDNTTIENYTHGIDGLGAAFQIVGGTFRGNDRGLYAEGTLDGNRVRVRDATFEGNRYGIYADDVALSLTDIEVLDSVTNGVYLLGDQDVDLTNVTVVGSGTAGLRAEGPLVTVQGGSFNESSFGIMIGSSTVVIDDIVARDNSNSGIVLYSEGTLKLRDSELRDNDFYNLQIRDNPAAVDLGVPADPGNNIFRLGSETTWSLLDRRPSLASANGVVITLYGNWFVDGGTWRSYDAAFDVVTGPESRNSDWRILGTNQRMRF